ncbi:hypothetical protein QFW82_23590 [Streptomyces malaysiensis subsp. malaysiensis]|uniref:hypothetical protein n=1 Tax=Streptomyces malaysiensis TaxID=92644 RepID=UPI0024C0A6FF|nr:hypothetical protein [Streptomyces sp. NA07423]WHX19815.1 hypothetical protein QFW82_23590 [Streptomyces sp. NA07423]
MGWINNAKGDGASRHAREAIQAGNSVLVYKFIEANTNSRATAPMTGMAEQIQAIEAEGWRLDKMAAAEGKALSGERVALVCLFRRM